MLQHSPCSEAGFIMQGSSLCSVLRHASQVQLGLQQMCVLLSVIHIKAAIFNSSGRYATNLLSVTVIKFSGPPPSIQQQHCRFLFQSRCQRAARRAELSRYRRDTQSVLWRRWFQERSLKPAATLSADAALTDRSGWARHGAAAAVVRDGRYKGPAGAVPQPPPARPEAFRSAAPGQGRPPGLRVPRRCLCGAGGVTRGIGGRCWFRGGGARAAWRGRGAPPRLRGAAGNARLSVVKQKRNVRGSHEKNGLCWSVLRGANKRSVLKFQICGAVREEWSPNAFVVTRINSAQVWVRAEHTCAEAWGAPPAHLRCSVGASCSANSLRPCASPRGAVPLPCSFCFPKRYLKCIHVTNGDGDILSRTSGPGKQTVSSTPSQVWFPTLGCDTAAVQWITKPTRGICRHSGSVQPQVLGWLSWGRSPAAG